MGETHTTLALRFAVPTKTTTNAKAAEAVSPSNAATTADPKPFQRKYWRRIRQLLLGDVDSAFRRFVAENKLRNIYFAPYIQDNIKLTPKFTLNAGLRWDIPRPFPGKQRQRYLLQRHSSESRSGQTGRNTSARCGCQVGRLCRLRGYRRAGIHWKDFSPRLGFAYQATKNTVVLVGFSVNFLDQGPYEFGNNKLSVDYGSLSGGQIVVNSFGSNIPHYGIWDKQSSRSSITGCV